MRKKWRKHVLNKPSDFLSGKCENSIMDVPYLFKSGKIIARFVVKAVRDNVMLDANSPYNKGSAKKEFK